MYRRTRTAMVKYKNHAMYSVVAIFHRRPLRTRDRCLPEPFLHPSEKFPGGEKLLGAPPPGSPHKGLTAVSPKFTDEDKKRGGSLSWRQPLPPGGPRTTVGIRCAWMLFRRARRSVLVRAKPGTRNSRRFCLEQPVLNSAGQSDDPTSPSGRRQLMPSSAFPTHSRARIGGILEPPHPGSQRRWRDLQRRRAFWPNRSGHQTTTGSAWCID